MRPIALFRGLVIFLALAAAAALLASAPGYRLGLWPFRAGISLVRWAGMLGAAAVLLACISLTIPRLRAGGVRGLLVALAVAGASAGITGFWAARGASAPRIHDISTDTDNPPAFVAALPLRGGAENSVIYGGPRLAAEQRSAYPDIAPLVLAAPPREAFARAQRAAAELGWRVIAADPVAGRLEATDRTAWFGFEDDIVVRIAAAEGGSRVDVRSVSRVGRSDLGANARRIRAFLARLR